MPDVDIRNLVNYLSAPLDAGEMGNERLAGVLMLSFIGMCARPKNISRELLDRCIEAFNNNRGKTEVEEAAILNVLNNYRI
jgi:hypothetical protein